MIRMAEICKRINEGPTMAPDVFDLDVVFMTARALCEKYNIIYDPDTPVPSDDDLADRTFKAAVDFVVQVGVYCPDTKTVIRFSRDEVLDAVANAPGRCIMGEGADQYEWTPRLPDSDTKPWFHVGTGIVNTDDRIAMNLVKAYANIPQANSISVPAVEKIDGQMVASGTPTEVLGAIRGIQNARTALGHAGRPGLAIGNCISTAGTAVASIAASTASLCPDTLILSYADEAGIQRWDYRDSLQHVSYELHPSATRHGKNGVILLSFLYYRFNIFPIALTLDSFLPDLNIFAC